MKSISLFLPALILSYSVFAQHDVPLRNLWAKPQVHVFFDGYTISFAIKDINRALALLAETGDTTNGLTSGLDENVIYKTDLYPDSKMEYHMALQSLLQNVVGGFLLTAGHAEIKRGRHKKLKHITVDIGELTLGEDNVLVQVYDPKSNKLIFKGKMKPEMYNRDLGID
jgi:hypothetical protein